MEGRAAHAPAIAGIDVLVDMGLVEIDQVVPIPLRGVEQRAEVLDEPRPPCGIGTSQQLASFLPGQVEPARMLSRHRRRAKRSCTKLTRRLSVHRGGGSAPAMGGAAAI